MTQHPRWAVSGRLRLAVAGAVVVTALTTATAAGRRPSRWGTKPTPDLAA